MLRFLIENNLQVSDFIAYFVDAAGSGILVAGGNLPPVKRMCSFH